MNDTNIRLYNADCMDAMREMRDKQYSLAIVDPPYGISEPVFRQGAKNKAAKNTAYHTEVFRQSIPSSEYFTELARVSTNQIVWGGNYFGLPGSRCWIVWDKDTMETQWADAELAWTSFTTSVRMAKIRWNGMLQHDMKNKERRIHPTQKPVALYRFLLKHYAKPGDTILDTHLGSASSAIAAYDMGFDFTGYELDPDYFSAAQQRFQRHTDQQQLFRV